MNKTETLHIEMPFSIAEIKKLMVNPNQDKNIRLENSQEVSINNYLKTQEEIDAEFCLEMNNSKAIFTEHKDNFETYGRIIKNRSGNAYSPDNTPSGFMEENY